MSLDQRMWGSNTILEFPNAGGPVDLPDVQLADVPLPESCVASVFFQAEVISRPSLTYNISYLTLTLNLGLGRVTVQRQVSWNGVPRLGVPIVFTLPFVPAKMVLASIRGGGNSFMSDPCQVLCTLEVAPISRFPAQDGLKFGMSKPGEADGLDDELLEDLEEHSPNKAAIMRHVQDSGGDASEVAGLDEDELDEDDDDEPARPAHIPSKMLPPRVRHIVPRLTRRLGRPPTVNDLPPWARAELQRHLRNGGAR